jgi:hypothetical protein
MATAITAASTTRPREASTPPMSTAISPGNTKPRNADASSAGRANTTARTTHPWRFRIQSKREKAIGLTVRASCQNAQPR